MNIALWIAQALLAVAFLLAGGMKLIGPIDEMIASGMPAALVRFIGFAEVAGALGLILPAALRIQPKLTIVAAGALAFVMLLAILTHVWMGDAAGSGPALLLGLLSVFVAWGRATKQPIAAREPVPAPSRA